MKHQTNRLIHSNEQSNFYNNSHDRNDINDIDSLSFLSFQEVRQLAKLFESVFAHFRQYRSSSELNFLHSIQIIADCYCLIIIDSGDSVTHDPHFKSFRAYQDFQKYPTLIHKLAHALAEMINGIADKVRLIPQPWFYPHFVDAVNTILSDKVACLNNQIPFAQHLQYKILQQACSNRRDGASS